MNSRSQFRQWSVRAAAGGAMAVAILLPAQATRGGITDFTTWTQVQDPANANLTSSATATQATLLAGNGSIPPATDIGYQSVNGQTVATSTAGNAFDPNASFTIAIDYNVSFANNATGYLGIGFGIGEDRDGMNSAGAVLLFGNGTPTIFFGGAARINDVTQSPAFILVGGSATGSMFASYDAVTGNITVGASQTPGASSPAGTTTFPGLQNTWANTDLLASFFLRSDNTLGTAWQAGNAQAVFSNFRVLSGNAVAVPEAGVTGMIVVTLGLLSRRRRRYGSAV